MSTPRVNEVAENLGVYTKQKRSSTCPLLSDFIKSMDKSTQTSSKHSALNLLGGGWDTVGEFDHNGGVINKSGSDVVLVPFNAISRGNVSSILGKYFTCLSEFVSIFDLAENDRIISPVVEFSVNSTNSFERHLLLKIPIVPSCKSCKSFRVLSLSDDRTVERVPPWDSVSSNPPDMYYQLKGDGFAYVYTKHFTAFACVCCDRNQLLLQGVVFGQCKRIQTGAEAYIRLYICDELYLVKDFRELLKTNEECMGRIKVDEKPIQIGKPNLQDEITMDMVLTADGWAIKLRPDRTQVFKPPKIKIKDVVRCPGKGTFPPLVGEWKFVAVDGSISFTCILDVEHTSRESEASRTTFDIRLSITSIWKLGNNQLKIAKLAEDLSQADAVSLARTLDIRETTLRHIKTDNSSSSKETTMQILLFCQRHLGDEKFNELLPEALAKIPRVDLVHRYENMMDGQWSHEHQSAAAGMSSAEGPFS